MIKVALVGMVASLACASHSQVVNVRLGVHSSCPDGLGGCWSGPYEALSDLKDITVDPKCDYTTWMANAKTLNGKLPDMDQIDKAVTGAGQFFRVRGYEVTVRGQLLVRGRQYFVSIPTEKNPILLAQVTQSHEWNPKVKSERQLSRNELDSYAGLKKIGPTQPVLITGWLNRPAADRPLTIEVVKVVTTAP